MTYNDDDVNIDDNNEADDAKMYISNMNTLAPFVLKLLSLYFFSTYIPILFVTKRKDKSLRLFKRNSRLYSGFPTVLFIFTNIFLSMFITTLPFKAHSVQLQTDMFETDNKSYKIQRICKNNNKKTNRQ